MLGRDIGLISLNLRSADVAEACPGNGSQMDVGARSDVGRVRQNNEDSFLTAADMNLHVLSDGMGGMAAGEIASRLTVETVVEHCRDANEDPSLGIVGHPIDGISEASNRLVSGIRMANRIVHKTTQETANRQKMGATVVAVYCLDGCMSVAHVGDSRAYRLRGDSLEQLTRDHSFVEELRQNQLDNCGVDHEQLQHMLTRAVGVEPEVEVEVRDELLMDGDTILLCSDGLTRELPDSEIARVLRGSRDAQTAADQLVALANESGGGDNITAVVIRHTSKGLGSISSFGRIGKWFSGRSN